MGTLKVVWFYVKTGEERPDLCWHNVDDANVGWLAATFPGDLEGTPSVYGYH